MDLIISHLCWLLAVSVRQTRPLRTELPPLMWRSESLAFALGEFLARYLAPVVFSPGPRFLTWERAFGDGLGAIFAAALATIGAFMGTSIVKKAWKES